LSAGSYEVAELTDPQAFLDLEADWETLSGAAVTDLPFLRSDWFRIWWSHFGEGRKLCLLTARREGRLVLAVPLMEERESSVSGPLLTLHSVTNAHSFRYQLLVARGEEASVDALWDHLRRRPRPWHVLEFERFPTGYAADQELIRVARASGSPVGVWEGGTSPYLAIEGDWDRYFASLKPKFRSNLRNRVKRLEKLGPLGYECVASVEECEAALRDAFAIEESGWKGSERSAIASNERLARFYTDWGRHAARRGWLRLWFLLLDGKRVAFEYDLEYKGVLYCLKIGYRPELHPFSAGQVLKATVLERAFREGLREYDFLGVMDEAKADWTSTGRPFNWAYVYHGGLQSRLHHALKFEVKPFVRRLMGRA